MTEMNGARARVRRIKAAKAVIPPDNIRVRGTVLFRFRGYSAPVKQQRLSLLAALGYQTAVRKFGDRYYLYTFPSYRD